MIITISCGDFDVIRCPRLKKSKKNKDEVHCAENSDDSVVNDNVNDDNDVLVMVDDGDDDLVVYVPLEHRMTLAEHHQRTHLL